MAKKNSNQLSKETKATYKAMGRRSRKFIKLTCNKCKREHSIRVNLENVKLYTEKIIKEYICLLCK